MKLGISMLLAIALLTTTAHAEEVKSYQLPITRNGKTTLRVAHQLWAGEYPGPIINVMAGEKGYYVTTAYQSLRDLNHPVKCSIKKGLYHPWSKTDNSIITYYTIAPRQEITAVKDTVLDSNKIQKGQTIINILSVGEGSCIALSGNKAIDFFCDNADTDAFIETIPSDEKYEQWMQVKCNEGYSAFIQDEMLLKSKGVTEGKIKTYGEILP